MTELLRYEASKAGFGNGWAIWDRVEQRWTGTFSGAYSAYRHCAQMNKAIEEGYTPDPVLGLVGFTREST